MKNYYQILQVDEKASVEIIEKAYKVLVKRYHPDLQKNEKNKSISEQKLKEINEAYDVLSDEFLREQYDLEFKREKEELYRKKYGEKSYESERKDFSNYKATTTNNSKKESNNDNSLLDDEKEEKRRLNQNLGTINGVMDLLKTLYKSRPKRQEFKEMTKKDLLALVLTILVVIAVGILLFSLPFTRDWMNELLFENPVFNFIGKFFGM